METQESKGGGGTMRALVSLSTAFSGVLLGLSGLILFFKPHGPGAGNLLLLSPLQWKDIHFAFAFFFLVAIFFHLYYNWRVLTGYLLKPFRGVGTGRASLACALVLTIALFVGAIFRLPPVTFILSEGHGPHGMQQGQGPFGPGGPGAPRAIPDDADK